MRRVPETAVICTRLELSERKAFLDIARRRGLKPARLLAEIIRAFLTVEVAR